MSTWKEWQRKLDDLSKRATMGRVVPLVLVDTGAWRESDRIAHRDGSDADREALEDQHIGQLPFAPDALRVVAIVTVSPLGPPEDDDDDVPTVNRWAESQARQEQAIQALEAAVIPEPDDDPQDAEPWGEPNAVIYHHPQFGPVSRAEHQLRRQRSREAALRRG